MTVTSVGAMVVEDDRLLVARMTYPPTKGEYMLPGGVVESGETLAAAVVREVAEETGMVVRPIGVIGVNSIVWQGETHTYIIWLAEPADGTPQPDGIEIDDCCFMTFSEIASRSDVSYLVKFLAERLQSGLTRAHVRSKDYAEFVGNLTPQTFQLYL